VRNSSGDDEPLEDDPTYHPNDGKHKPTPYKGPNGPISAEPTNGEEVLEDSVPTDNPNSRKRVGVDPENGEIVVFQPESDKGIYRNRYHGYEVEWSDLRQDEKNALIKNGLTDRKGNILPQRLAA
jgi:hypothetical protein